MKIASRTDVGRVRSVNEDRVAVLPDWNGSAIAIVADGMGGHQAGDVASRIAVESIKERLASVRLGMSAEECEEAIRQAIVAANRDIFQLSISRKQYSGMGTTVVVAVVMGDSLVIGHIGDSRAYLSAAGELKQLTEDHSLVNELLRTGTISEEEALLHPRRNVLTRAMGTEADAVPDVCRFSLNDGDIVLLCTDGLTSLVEHETLSEILAADRDVEWKADRLVECALEAGGDDNVTVVLLANESDGPEKRGDGK